MGLLQAYLPWRKKKCPQQKINKEMRSHKNAGQVDIVAGMFFMLLLSIVILFGFRMSQYVVTSAYVEDALAASNLASAVIDLEEYGKSHRVIIPDPEQAFCIFREALCHNLHLDTSLHTTNRDILATRVKIEEYHIYNVRNDVVEVFVMDESGTIWKQYEGIKGQVFTPDGVCVENTTIYSRVAFDVKGMGQENIQGRKEKSVDIVRYESEE